MTEAAQPVFNIEKLYLKDLSLEIPHALGLEQAVARYPLIIAGNRDEYHDRPGAPTAWWDDHPRGVFGGRDLAGGGSWLAVSRSGRFAVVLNNPQRPPGPTRTASRGHLVRDFVAGSKPSGRYLDAVQVNAQTYAGFCLLLGTAV